MPMNSESAFAQKKKKKKKIGSGLKRISKECLEMENKSLSFCPLTAIKKFPFLNSFKNNLGTDNIVSQWIRRQGVNVVM